MNTFYTLTLQIPAPTTYTVAGGSPEEALRVLTGNNSFSPVAGNPSDLDLDTLYFNTPFHGVVEVARVNCADCGRPATRLLEGAPLCGVCSIG